MKYLKYLAVYCNQDGILTNGKMGWKFYKRHKDKWYIDKKGDGWAIEKLEKLDLLKRMPNEFIVADSIEEINKIIKTKSFHAKYGDKIKEDYDFCCPNCNYHFVAPCHQSVHLDDIRMTVSCICGNKFVAITSYEITKKIIINA